MLISLAAVAVSPNVWISNVTDEDVVAFGRPQTTGLGSHLINLRAADLDPTGMLTFERRDALFIRRGRTSEAVLFRELTRGKTIITPVEAAIRPGDSVYWVTVGKGRQGNFEIGMRNGVWGVETSYANHLRDVVPGDKIIFYGRDVGFALCEVRSHRYHDPGQLWPDGVYPYRIKITPPLKRNEAEDFRNVYHHLRDIKGSIYASAQAAGRAIGGPGGVFRRLKTLETAGLLSGLGWQ